MTNRTLRNQRLEVGRRAISAAKQSLFVPTLSSVGKATVKALRERPEKRWRVGKLERYQFLCNLLAIPGSGRQALTVCW
jgi:hypothetical protein